MADTVKVNLRHSVGLRGSGKLYGPGDGVEVPVELANALGLSPVSEADAGEDEDTRLTAAEAAALEDAEPLSLDPAEAKKAEMEAEAERLNLKVERAEGDGDPLVDDYRRVLSEYAEALEGE